jgi:hypothetical protein
VKKWTFFTLSVLELRLGRPVWNSLYRLPYRRSSEPHWATFIPLIITFYSGKLSLALVMLLSLPPPLLFHIFGDKVTSNKIYVSYLHSFIRFKKSQISVLNFKHKEIICITHSRITKQLPNSMQHRSPWEAYILRIGQEILCLSWRLMLTRFCQWHPFWDFSHFPSAHPPSHDSINNILRKDMNYCPLCVNFPHRSIASSSILLLSTSSSKIFNFSP